MQVIAVVFKTLDHRSDICVGQAFPFRDIELKHRSQSAEQGYQAIGYMCEIIAPGQVEVGIGLATAFVNPDQHGVCDVEPFSNCIGAPCRTTLFLRVLAFA